MAIPITHQEVIQLLGVGPWELRIEQVSDPEFSTSHLCEDPGDYQIFYPDKRAILTYESYKHCPQFGRGELEAICEIYGVIEIIITITDLSKITDYESKVLRQDPVFKWLGPPGSSIS